MAGHMPAYWALCRALIPYRHPELHLPRQLLFYLLTFFFFFFNNCRHRKQKKEQGGSKHPSPSSTHSLASCGLG